MEWNLFLQRGRLSDIATLEPSTLYIFLFTTIKFQDPAHSSTVSKSIGSSIDFITVITTLKRVSSKYFSAVHTAVSAGPIIAATLFRTGHSILHIKIIQRHIETVPWQYSGRSHILWIGLQSVSLLDQVRFVQQPPIWHSAPTSNIRLTLPLGCYNTAWRSYSHSPPNPLPQNFHNVLLSGFH